MKEDNIIAIHDPAQGVSAKLLFKGAEGTTRALQIQKDSILQEHITKVEALLICVMGEVQYEDETGKISRLQSGDYLHIAPMVKHKVTGIQDSQLLLLK